MPWGNARQVAPLFMMSPTPEELRREEYGEAKPEGRRGTGRSSEKDFHNHLNHEYFRFAPYALGTRLLNGVRVWSKIIFWFLALSGMWVTVTGAWEAEKDSVQTFFKFLVFTVVMTSPSLVVWGISAFLLSRFSGRLVQPGKGPSWELNRRTGVVTLFQYKGQQVTTQSVPFHEFDAYIQTRKRTQELWLRHRHSQANISFLPILGGYPSNETLWAFWDFLQNYMDTSQPLPDVPALEKYRVYDPVTVRYDRETGRAPRYWIDMDEESFRKALVVMEERVEGLDTESRPDLMARYVKYPS